MTMKLHKLQLTRRTVQFLVLAFILAVPVAARYVNYLSARELDKNIEKWDGTLQGEVIEGADSLFRSLPDGEVMRVDSLVRNREQVLEYAQQFRGGMWSAEAAGLSITDPLAGVESIAASKTVETVLLISLIFPVLVTLLLGRVFCSWLCPMNLLLEFTDKLRRVLRFLELKPRDLRFSRWIKYTLLALGLVLAALVALPFLGYVYPPAIIGRELHDLVFGIFDAAERGEFGFVADGLTWMSLIIIGIVLFEITVSRRWWCRYVCPGGAVYSIIGAWRPVRVKRAPTECTRCGECTAACPVGLKPGNDEMGHECDNCGLCISHCSSGALGYRLGWEPNRFRLPVLLLATIVAVGVSAPPLLAHHILGIPHYAYDEQYPQTPVLTYRVNAGPHEVKMTGYPGMPTPGERCAYHVYIQRIDNGAPFDSPVTMRVFRDRLLGEDPVVYGPVEARLEQAVYKFFPRFEEEANFLVRIEFQAEGAPWIIDLPVVVGAPGSPWTVAGSSLGALVVFLVVIRAIRIKMRRRAAASIPVVAEPAAEGARR